jgi:hypothetical protein
MHAERAMCVCHAIGVVEIAVTARPVTFAAELAAYPERLRRRPGGPCAAFVLRSEF